MDLLGIAGEQTAGETLGGFVVEPDGLFQVFGLENVDDGSKGFAENNFSVVFEVSDDSWLDKVAWSFFENFTSVSNFTSLK